MIKIHRSNCQFILRFLNKAIWAYSKGDNRGWFRLFGYGIKWKHKDEPKLFSERYNHTKYLIIGDYIFSYLPPYKL